MDGSQTQFEDRKNIFLKEIKEYIENGLILSLCCNLIHGELDKLPVAGYTKSTAKST